MWWAEYIQAYLLFSCIIFSEIQALLFTKVNVVVLKFKNQFISNKDLFFFNSLGIFESFFFFF